MSGPPENLSRGDSGWVDSEGEKLIAELNRLYGGLAPGTASRNGDIHTTPCSGLYGKSALEAAEAALAAAGVRPAQQSEIRKVLGK